MKVPNLPKRTENQTDSAGEKPKDKYDETELPRFTSQLSNRFLLFLWPIAIVLEAPKDSFNSRTKVKMRGQF